MKIIKGNKGEILMKNNVRPMVLAAVAATVVAAALTGCGQARSTADIQKTTEAPVIKVTEKVTEAPQTEAQTQAPQTETQAPQTETQAPQTETQAPQTETQAQTQPQTTAAPLSKEEEVAQETEYEQSKTMWAMDDINVRDTPTTEEDNISYSLDQGQTATVIGETPSWYEITIPYTDENGNPADYVGFVSKQYMSDTEVAPKTEEERAADAAAAGETTADQAAADQAAADQAAAQPAAEQTAAAPTTATTPVAGGTTVTMASDANIRADASQTSDVLGVVSAGEQVSVIGDADGWYQVDYNGVQGFVNKNLVG